MYFLAIGLVKNTSRKHELPPSINYK